MAILVGGWKASDPAGAGILQPAFRRSVGEGSSQRQGTRSRVRQPSEGTQGSALALRVTSGHLAFHAPFLSLSSVPGPNHSRGTLPGGNGTCTKHTPKRAVHLAQSCSIPKVPHGGHVQPDPGSQRLQLCRPGTAPRDNTHVLLVSRVQPSRPQSSCITTTPATLGDRN